MEDIPNMDTFVVVQRLAEVSRETFLYCSPIPSPTPSPSHYHANVAWLLQLWVGSTAGAGRKASVDSALAGMAVGMDMRRPRPVTVRASCLDQPEAFACLLYFCPSARTVVEAAEPSAEAGRTQARVEDTLVLGWPGMAVVLGAVAVADVVQLSTVAMEVLVAFAEPGTESVVVAQGFGTDMAVAAVGLGKVT